MSALKVRTSTGPDVWTVVAANTGNLKVRTATGPDVWTTATTSNPGQLKVRTATGPDVWTPIIPPPTPPPTPPVLRQAVVAPQWADPAVATFPAPLFGSSVVTVHVAAWDSGAEGIPTPTATGLTFTSAYPEITSTVHASFRNRTFYAATTLTTAPTVSVAGLSTIFLAICEWTWVNATVLDVASVAVNSDTSTAPTATFNGTTITPANSASTIVSFIGLRDTSSVDATNFTPPTGFTKIGQNLVDATGLKGALAYGPNAALTWSLARGAGTGTVGGMIGTIALRPA